jgi:hypothetical protein
LVEDTYLTNNQVWLKNIQVRLILLNYKKIFAITLGIILVFLLSYIGFKYYKYDFDKVHYSLSFSFVPIEGGDYSIIEKTNRQLLKLYQAPENKELQENVNELLNNFEIINQVSFIKSTDSNFGEMNYQFSEEIVKKKRIDQNIRYTFDPQDEINGIPVIRVKADIAFKPYTSYQVKNININDYLTKEKYWPVGHTYFKNILHNILKENMSEKEKVLAISQWINDNMRPAEEKGTRYGALKAAQTKRGRCMDYSDVFITLCRTADIPTRQVFGRNFNGGGHAWTEVYIKDQGWFPVEPQYDILGVSKIHIPLTISSDGNYPLIYWTLPKMKKIDFIDYLLDI